LTTNRKATPSRNGGPLILNRHPPDDGLVEAEIAAFGGFWQYQFLDTGRPCTNADDSRRVERRKCGFDHHTLEALRERAVRKVQEGESPEVVASVFGLNGRRYMDGWRSIGAEAVRA
jgi:hypothetical protein